MKIAPNFFLKKERKVQGASAHFLLLIPLYRVVSQNHFGFRVEEAVGNGAFQNCAFVVADDSDSVIPSALQLSQPTLKTQRLVATRRAHEAEFKSCSGLVAPQVTLHSLQ